ncbi:GIY-YIG nuclease family protein [Specibacter sp. NPDC078709]|uniref:GIY-YIG nuclease family protein n=1 Tax=Specibacter sp. NPDC078709 TaxID=3154364 RepID=UPI00341D49DD
MALLEDRNFQLAGAVINAVPDQPGVYAIRVVEFGVLPEPFRAYAEERNDPLIYVGEAKESLRKRLGQELWAKGHGTFFRSIGAVIGYRPLPGSLAGKVNKSNYTFAPEDEAAIIRWINRNLEVAWLVLDGAVHDTEARIIREFGPLLNLSGNPRKLPELSIVREECRRLASQSLTIDPRG